MLFAEPPRTRYDLNFYLGRIPVRVHPLFWLVAVLLGARGGLEPVVLLTWVAVVFVSILIHELGHALAIRYYGWEPSVILYQLGGLATYNPGFTSSVSSYGRRGNTPLAQIAISAAGPAAGFIVAGAVIAGLYAFGLYVDFFGVQIGRGAHLSQASLSGPTTLLVRFLLEVNIFWGLLNLCPIYPLDGGKISREIFLVTSPADGLRQSLVLSIVFAAGLALCGFLLWDQFFLAILFGFLAYNNYVMLQSYGSGGFGRPW